MYFLSLSYHSEGWVCSQLRLNILNYVDQLLGLQLIRFNVDLSVVNLDSSSVAIVMGDMSLHIGMNANT